MNKINVFFSFVCFFSIRSAVFGATLADAIAITAGLGLVGYNKYLETTKIEPINTRVLEELETVKATVAGIKMANTMRR